MKRSLLIFTLFAITLATGCGKINEWQDTSFEQEIKSLEEGMKLHMKVTGMHHDRLTKLERNIQPQEPPAEEVAHEEEPPSISIKALGHSSFTTSTATSTQRSKKPLPNVVRHYHYYPAGAVANSPLSLPGQPPATSSTEERITKLEEAQEKYVTWDAMRKSYSDPTKVAAFQRALLDLLPGQATRKTSK